MKSEDDAAFTRKLQEEMRSDRDEEDFAFAQEMQHMEERLDEEHNRRRAEEERAGEEYISFQQVRDVFPSLQELGGFAPTDPSELLFDDEVIHAALAAHDHNAESTVNHLRSLLKKGSPAKLNALRTSAAMRQQEESDVLVARRIQREEDKLAADRASASVWTTVKAPAPATATPRQSEYIGPVNAVVAEAQRILLGHQLNADFGLQVSVDGGAFLRFLGFQNPPSFRQFETNLNLKAYCLDVHNVHVKEALQLVSSMISFRESVNASKRPSNFDPSAAVGLLVGRGVHSKGGKIKLAPNINRYLTAQGILCKVVGPWVIVPSTQAPSTGPQTGVPQQCTFPHMHL